MKIPPSFSFTQQSTVAMLLEDSWLLNFAPKYHHKFKDGATGTGHFLKGRGHWLLLSILRPTQKDTKTEQP